MAEPVAIVALALEAVIGWPARLHARLGHPVGGFARIIGFCERRWNRPGSPVQTQLAGIGTLFLVMAVGGGAGWLIEQLASALFGRAAWMVIAVAALPALAQRSLFSHVTPVLRALESGDLPSARASVAMIVGRDTQTLGEEGVSAATVESLAESFCDGVVAPLFWLLALGLPGIWAYKAVNTADSLIGHPEPPLRAFGWASARTDDVANFLPARISGALICAASLRGWATMWRDHGKHASPNAGWPEAAIAGALDVRLGGPASYDGTLLDKGWLGHGRAPTAKDIRRALAVYVRACALLWLLAGGTIWLA